MFSFNARRFLRKSLIETPINCLAESSADQKIVQSHRAVEIETLKAQAEVEPLNAQAEQLALLKASGPGALEAYLRNVRLALYGKADRLIVEVR